MTYTVKVWKSGKTGLAVIIPQSARVINNIQQGDYLEIEIKNKHTPKTQQTKQEEIDRKIKFWR